MEWKILEIAELESVGNPKGDPDYRVLKSNVAQMLAKNDLKTLTYKMKEADTITSAFVGYLLKLVNHDKIEVKLEVSPKLEKILNDLALQDAFQIKVI